MVLELTSVTVFDALGVAALRLLGVKGGYHRRVPPSTMNFLLICTSRNFKGCMPTASFSGHLLPQADYSAQLLLTGVSGLQAGMHA